MGIKLLDDLLIYKVTNKDLKSEKNSKFVPGYFFLKVIGYMTLLLLFRENRCWSFIRKFFPILVKDELSYKVGLFWHTNNYHEKIN